MSYPLGSVLFMDGSASLADRRQVIAACADVLRDLHTVVFQCPTGELGDLVGELAELHALALAQLPVVVADAEVRGVVEESQAASTTAWVADHGWHARRQAPTVAKAAKLLRRPELGAVAESMLTADIDPATAVVVGAEFDKLVKDLKPDAAPVVLDHMLNVAADDGPGAVRQLAAGDHRPVRRAGRLRGAAGEVSPAHRPDRRSGNLRRGAGTTG